MDKENTDFRNTLKLTWLADVPNVVLTPAVCVQFDHIISKGVLKPEEDFKNFINYDSMVTSLSCMLHIACDNISFSA